MSRSRQIYQAGIKKIKPYLRRVIYVVPGAQELWTLWNGLNNRPDFIGWGMVTHTFTPWHGGGGDEIARDFLKAHREIVTQVKQGKFNLSQFNDFKDKTRLLNGFMWRHYIVFWSARYASKATNCPIKNLVECGVCDGLTVFFAMNALNGKYEFKSFLYDAWAGMKSEYLSESEMGSAGEYYYLSIENTKHNLVEFQTKTVFNKGYIPETFQASDNPTEIVWLHIDLNSAMPTTAALKYFFGKMPPGGVILFDDYAWHGFHDTKLAVDEFLSRQAGVLLPMPTGQAIYLKH